MKRVTLYVCAMLILSACAQNVHDVETNISENFTAKYTTYKWIPDSKRRMVPEAAQELMKKTDQLLSSKGYKKVSSQDPDFLMSFDISTLKNDMTVKTTSAIDNEGVGVSCRGGNCESTNKNVITEDRTIKVNILVLLELKAQDANSDISLWTANSQVNINDGFDAETSDRMIDINKARTLIDSAVAKMTNEVPSKK